MTGWFQGTATFGPGESNETQLATTSNSMFLAKYNSDGTLAWATHPTGLSGDHNAYAIAVDGSGNSYVTGRFSNTTIFGPGVSLTSGGATDIFVAKYDTNGTLAWAKRAGGGSGVFHEGHAIAIDGSGNSYVTGGSRHRHFWSRRAERDPADQCGGHQLWGRRTFSSQSITAMGRSPGPRALEIQIVDTGDGYSRGRLGEPLRDWTVHRHGYFRSRRAEQTQLTSVPAGFYDIFVAKYNSNGTLAWAKRAGSTGDDQGLGIAVDGWGTAM